MEACASNEELIKGRGGGEGGKMKKCQQPITHNKSFHFNCVGFVSYIIGAEA